MIDADAAAYVALVEAADGQTLESGVRQAFDNFVIGCKADSIWTPLKSACILAGARTLTGALVPLIGTAPTNNNFVSGDYNRVSGLIGDGTTKYLNTNRLDSVDPQNDHHASVYVSQAGGGYYLAGNLLINGPRAINPFVADIRFWSKSISFTVSGGASATGMIGLTRTTSTNCTIRVSGANSTQSIATNGNAAANVYLYARNGTSDVPAVFSNARLSFYSLGTNLDLAALDARLATLMSDLAAALS